MNAAEIIEEIKHLPPHEQAFVAEFVESLDVKRPWTPEELGKAAEQLVAETDPVRAQALQDRMVAGFYGRG